MVASIIVASPVRVVALRAVTDTALWSIGWCLDVVAVDPGQERGDRVLVEEQPLCLVVQVACHPGGEVVEPELGLEAFQLHDPRMRQLRDPLGPPFDPQVVPTHTRVSLPC